MFLIKFNEKYEVCCHGNICASTLPTSFKARYVILKPVKLPSQMIKLTQTVSSKFAEFSLFTVVCHQQIYRLFAIYSRLSPENLPNICYLQSTVTNKFTEYLLLTVDCHQPLLNILHSSYFVHFSCMVCKECVCLVHEFLSFWLQWLSRV